MDTTLPPEVAAEEQVTLSDEILEVSLKGGAVVTALTTEIGTNYKAEITGDGVISLAAEDSFTDFTNLQGSWVLYSTGVQSGTPGTYTGGTGWVHGDHTEDDNDRVRGVRLKLVLPASGYIERVSVQFDYTRGNWNVSSHAAGIFYNDGGIQNGELIGDSAIQDGVQGLVWNVRPPIQTDEIYIIIRSDNVSATGDPRTGSVTITAARVNGVDERGDAFYRNYQSGSAAIAYSAGKGFTVDGSAPTAPAFKSSHNYEITVAGTDATLSLAYIDEDGDYSDNENKNLRVEITALP